MTDVDKEEVDALAALDKEEREYIKASLQFSSHCSVPLSPTKLCNQCRMLRLVVSSTPPGFHALREDLYQDVTNHFVLRYPQRL